jgi:hypothetical protein
MLDSTPELVCMQVTITDSYGDVVATIAKNNCGETGREFQSASRHFMYGGKTHSANAQSWYRREDR